MRRMEKVTGRTDDMIIIRGVNLFPTQIEELILAEPELSPHFQCVLTRPQRLDELTVRVESRDGALGRGRRRRRCARRRTRQGHHRSQRHRRRRRPGLGRSGPPARCVGSSTSA
jgi:phenylacetate-coenzyme A ligase PaaK-like adenylate-forming protein